MSRKPKPSNRKIPTKTKAKTDACMWIWGTHSAMAALQNADRHILRILATRNAASQITGARWKPLLEVCDPGRISAILPEGAVHQGLAVAVMPLPTSTLDQVLAQKPGTMLMLDQVTDPRNVGAIFRSAAAFGAKAIIAQDRHFPPLSGVLTKAAVGAVETVPLIPVTNLSRALEQTAMAGYVSIGLAGETDMDIGKIDDLRPKVLVMGAEGKGIRPNVRNHCDLLARIPMNGYMESLNVSVAASIALYELARQSG